MLIKKEIHIFKPTYLNHNHMPKVFYKTLLKKIIIKYFIKRNAFYISDNLII